MLCPADTRVRALLRPTLLALAAATWALGAPALAAPEPTPTPSPSIEPADAPRRGSEDVPRDGAVWFTHHGSFRLRPELLLGADLGAGVSGVPAPLGATTGVDADAATLAWTSIRLRYEPTFHVGPSLSIHLGLDALDNLVLGSTHENAGGDLGLGLLDDAQAPPSAGRFGWQDALEVRQAYGRWQAFDFVDLRFGRMADEFGLGILRNAGDCADCDFGSIVDRVAAAFTISGFRVDAAWEFTAVGATSDLAFEHARAAGGQPTDLGQSDDVTTYTLKVGREPASAAEHAARAKLLDEERGWAIDWALYSQFTDQTLSSLEQTGASSVECAPSGELKNGQPIQPYECIRLFRRDAFFWRPGFWLKAERRPSFGETIRLELEASALIGDVAHPQRLFEEDDQEAKDFMGFGMAAELEWRLDPLALGLDFGFATGDDGPYVGVLDGNNVVDPDDDNYATNKDIRDNRTITSFYFHRDYHLDLILFRQVLGAVTNAAYLKPWIATDVLRTDAATLTLRLDMLYALAMRPSGTPGGGDHWGLELDGRATLTLRSGLSASLGLGVLVPFDGLADPDTGANGDPAMAIRALLGWSF